MGVPHRAKVRQVQPAGAAQDQHLGVVPADGPGRAGDRNPRLQSRMLRGDLVERPLPAHDGQVVLVSGGDERLGQLAGSGAKFDDAQAGMPEIRDVHAVVGRSNRGAAVHGGSGKFCPKRQIGVSQIEAGQ